MRAGANIKLTVPGKTNIEVSGGGTKDHSKLKRLGFEESGHTGFQKELTAEQLANIDSVAVPDWSQSDETQAGFIKNRTHYVKRRECGITLSAELVAEHEDGYIYRYYSASERDITPIGTVYIDGLAYDSSNFSLHLPNGEILYWHVFKFDEEGQPLTAEYVSEGFLYDSPQEIPDLYIYWYEEGEAVPLDDKFIPDTVERMANKITKFTGGETDDKYPTAKAVYNKIQEMISASDRVIFTPSVSKNGDLSWTNDGGLDNPETVNIKGGKGDPGVSPTLSMTELKDENGDRCGYEVFLKDAEGEKSFLLTNGVSPKLNVTEGDDGYEVSIIENGIVTETFFIPRGGVDASYVDEAISGKADKTYVDTSIQSAILDSWEVAV